MGKHFLERVLEAVDLHRNALGLEASAAFLKAWVEAAKSGEYGEQYSPEEIEITKTTAQVEAEAAKLLKRRDKAGQN